MNQQAIALLIEVLNRRHQPGLEAVIEEAGIQHQLVVGLEDFNRHIVRRWCGFSQIAIGKICVSLRNLFFNKSKFHPFAYLLLILDSQRVEFLGNPVESDAVVGFNNEFLLEPQLFLEILKLGQKVDQLASLS